VPKKVDYDLDAIREKALDMVGQRTARLAEWIAAELGVTPRRGREIVEEALPDSYDQAVPVRDARLYRRRDDWAPGVVFVILDAAERNSAERNSAERNSAERNSAERNSAERNSSERNTAERNSAESLARTRSAGKRTKRRAEQRRAAAPEPYLPEIKADPAKLAAAEAEPTLIPSKPEPALAPAQLKLEAAHSAVRAAMRAFADRRLVETGNQGQAYREAVEILNRYARSVPDLDEERAEQVIADLEG
jgi:hypothetical protein